MNRDEFDDFWNGLDDSYDLTGTKMRIHEAAANNFEYFADIGRSDGFLRDRVGERLDMATLLVDMVGSTNLSRVLSERTLTVMMTSFTLEMAYLVDEFDGYVLKFVGDAAIGYFVGSDSANRAAQCAIGMVYKNKHALNEMFSWLKCNEEDKILDKLNDGGITTEEAKLIEDMTKVENFAIKVGLNYGANTVVRYGRSKQGLTPVDLIGYPLNLTAKIQGCAQRNEILAGEHLYDMLSQPMQAKFEIKQPNNFKYHHPGTSNRYKLYSHSV